MNDRAIRWAGGVAVLGLVILLVARWSDKAPSPAVISSEAGTGRTTHSGPEMPLVELEHLIVQRSNRMRVREGLTPLRTDTGLGRVARAHSADMLRRGYFLHESPEGVTPERRIHLGHRTLIGTTGENLWSGSGYLLVDLPAIARGIVDDWMASPGHRDNLLRPDFTHLGVGIAYGEGGQIRATQNLGAVRAYLRHPFPRRLTRQAVFSVSPDGVELVGDQLVAPEYVAFRGDHDVTMPPQHLGVLRLPSTGGRYQLQVYFPQERPRHFLLIPGPEVEIH